MSLRQRGLASSSISTMINAIYHFYDMNDVVLNKKKIKMFIGQSPRKVVDRAYSHEEISRILNVSDLRMKSLVLLMATAGLRIGAISQLRLRNLEKLILFYKLVIYEGSKEDYTHSVLLNALLSLIHILSKENRMERNSIRTHF